MCESGGNYSAVNPSSGAGGAYQILPSTWDLVRRRGQPRGRARRRSRTNRGADLGGLRPRRLGLRRVAPAAYGAIAAGYRTLSSVISPRLIARAIA